MDSIVFTQQDIRVLRMAARFLRERELQLPETAHSKTHEGVLVSALWLDHEADKLAAAPQTPSRETRRPIFNHLVAPAAGGPVCYDQAKAMLDAHESAVQAETLGRVDERLAAMTLPEHLKGTFNAGSYADAWRHCRNVVQDMAAALRNTPPAAANEDAHRCNLPPTRRLPCGCCPHQVCEGCEGCAHKCQCGGTPAK